MLNRKALNPPDKQNKNRNQDLILAVIVLIQTFYLKICFDQKQNST